MASYNNPKTSSRTREYKSTRARSSGLKFEYIKFVNAAASGVPFILVSRIASVYDGGNVGMSTLAW